jgi:hypothetical protein
MDDKTIMENLLMTTKGACDLYMHGAIESPSPKRASGFQQRPESGITLQTNVYKQMSQKGGIPQPRPTSSRSARVGKKIPLPSESARNPFSDRNSPGLLYPQTGRPAKDAGRPLFAGLIILVAFLSPGYTIFRTEGLV